MPLGNLVHFPLPFARRRFALRCLQGAALMANTLLMMMFTAAPSEVLVDLDLLNGWERVCTGAPGTQGA